MDDTRTLGPRQQGDLGELSAMQWFGAQGAAVFVPITHSSDVDLVVVQDGRVQRVQVKTSRAWRADGFEVSICTRGGNQSWNGLVSVFSTDRCDLLFVLVADGRRWRIPADAVEARQGMLLGGPKYAEYEIDPGLPFAVQMPAATRLPEAAPRLLSL